MAVIKKDYNASSLPVAFSRGNGIPLDKSSLWFSLEEMQAYSASNPIAYVGQILALVDETSNAAKAYIITNEAGDLQEVGSATVGDNKTIVLKDDGVLALKNWGVEYYKWVDAVGEEGQEGYVAGHHEKQTVDAEHPWIAGLEPKAIAGADGTFELAWYQPSTTTVEGLSSTVSTIRTSVDEITAALGDAETAGTIRYDIAGKLDKAGGTMTGDLILSDGAKAASETVVDTKIATAIGSAGHLKRAIVEALPEVAEADADTIYMIKDANVTSGDAYKEYMLIEGAFAQIGDTSVDLTPYAKIDLSDGYGSGNLIVINADGTLQDSGQTIADIDSQIAAVASNVSKKVDKEDGKSLISDTLISKVEGLANIKSIGSNLTLSEEGVLSAQDSYELPIASTTVLGGVMVDGTTIKADETGKISVPAADATAAGLLSKDDFTKIQNIEAGAQVNTVIGALLGGTEAEINENKQIVVPVASETAMGLVKSSADNDKVAVGTDGTMSLNKVSTTKLYVPDGDEFVLDGGAAN